MQRTSDCHFHRVRHFVRTIYTSFKLSSPHPLSCCSVSLSGAVVDVSPFLPVLMPVLVVRLGSQEVVEPSEELRLSLVALLSALVQQCTDRIAPYVSDMVTILQRTIVDPFPEVKKVKTNPFGVLFTPLCLLGELCLQHKASGCHPVCLLPAVRVAGQAPPAVSAAPALQSQGGLPPGVCVYVSKPIRMYGKGRHNFLHS